MLIKAALLLRRQVITARDEEQKVGQFICAPGAVTSKYDQSTWVKSGGIRGCTKIIRGQKWWRNNSFFRFIFWEGTLSERQGEPFYTWH